MKKKLTVMLLAAGSMLSAWAVCSHSSTSSVVDKEASCTQSGVYHLVCDYCGETVESGLAIDPLGHDYRLNEHLDPTSTDDGYDVYLCFKCGDSYQVSIPKLSPGDAKPGFAEQHYEVEESGMVDIFINGGSADGASSVKVYLSYNSAVAADFDLANATVNGVKIKGGLKFPLTLSWDAGDTEPKRISIPVKADKSVEDGEFFTLQLADAVGFEVGEDAICTVTVVDPGYAELQKKIEDNTASPAEIKTWTKLQAAKAPYMRALASPASAGKMTGSGFCPDKKKVSLKATANKGWVFVGWRQGTAAAEAMAVESGNGFVAKTPTLVIDRTANPGKATNASTTITDITESTTFYAEFATVEADKNSIGLVLDGEQMSAGTETVPAITNYCGVAVVWPVEASALSATTVKASGLPAGVKLVQDKDTGAWSLSGAPTAASKEGKDGNLVPSRVKLTVTTAGKSSKTYAFDWTILSLPAWAVGSFEGFATTISEDYGPASMSVTAAGKVSGKLSLMGTNWTFKADSYVDSLFGAQGIYDGGVHAVYAVATATAGKSVRKMLFGVNPFELYLCPDSAISFVRAMVLKEGVDSMQSESDAEWLVLMYRIPWTDKGDTAAAGVIASYAGSYSCLAQYGDEKCPVSFTLDEKGVIKGTVEVMDGAKTRKVPFSTYALPYYDPDGLFVSIAVSADPKKGYPAIFAAGELINHCGKPKDEKVFRDPGVVTAIAAHDDPAAAGAVSVSPKYGQVAAGEDVTLTAKAAPGSVFSHWEIVGVDTDGLDLSSTKLKIKAPGDDDVFATAIFMTVAEDAGSVILAVGGVEMRRVEDNAPYQTNICAGVYLEWPIAADALSQTTVKVSGLPSGLKFDAKSNTIYGAPTAASKADGKGGVKPSDVKITVTTAGKSSITYLVKLTVDPLPAWAVGDFNGECRMENGELPAGTVSLTIAASGKISGKMLENGKTWTLSVGQFNHVEHVEQVGGSDVFYAAVVGKAGKEIVTNEVTVSASDGMGVASGLTTTEPTLSWTAWQNLWKRADTKASQPVFKKNIDVEYHFGAEGDKNNTVKITFKKDGAVSFSGKIGGVSVSGSSQLVWNGECWQVTFYAAPKPTAKPPFEGWCETFDVKLTLDKQNIVTAVSLGGEEPEMVQLWEGGPYWATKNIGAEKPEDSGYYFWWGDSIGYKRENDLLVASDGSVSGFSFEESNVPTSRKDVAALLSEGWIVAEDDTYVLAPEHDAAQAHWGGGWRIPTRQEQEGLIGKCNWTWTTMNGVRGYEVRGSGAYASNSIFLPSVGAFQGTVFNDWNGVYWSSTYSGWSSGYGQTSWIFWFDTENHGSYTGPCIMGYPIRPVQDVK